MFQILIIRLIYLFDGPSPNDLLKKIEEKIEKIDVDNSNVNQLESLNSENLNKTVNEKILNVANSKNSKNNILLIKSYREFVDLFYQHKEGMLHTL